MDSVTNNKPSLIDPRPISETGSSFSHAAQSGVDKAITVDPAAGRMQKRSGAENLSRSHPIIQAEGNIKATAENKALDIFSSLFNTGKKTFRLACLLCGYLSATGAVIFTFAFNIKTLGLLFGIPALLFFYTATTLGTSIKQDPGVAVDKDPFGNLRKITEDNPEYLRENPGFVLRTIKAVANMRKNTPLYFRTLERLASLEEAVKMEQIQLAGLDDERSLRHQEQMMDYLRAIENIFEEDGTIVKPSTSRNTNASIVDLHRKDQSLSNTQVT